MSNNKSKTAYLCSSCGEDFPKWNGQCNSCKEWGTLAEFKVSKGKSNKPFQKRETKSLSDILNLNFLNYLTKTVHLIPILEILFLIYG